MYSDPAEIFDTVIDDKRIMERADSITQCYDDFMNYARKYEVTGKGSSKELKRKLWRALVTVNILEGIRFYVSFACTFAFGELKLMEGSAKIISFIARDESQHLAITQHIIKNFKKGENDEEMLEVIKEEEEWMYEAYRDAVDEEKRWAQYLFKDGSMIGLNEKLLADYVEWVANKRMKAIGLDLSSASSR